MTVAVKEISLENKIKELEERLSQKPVTLIDENGAAHIVFTPSENNAPEVPDLKETLQIVRDNFSRYTENAIHDLKTTKILSTYLDIALKDFANNVQRFMPNIKNTDYKLEISVNERNKTSVRIGFKNPQGKRIGPFLTTHITSMPYDMLSVDIGYIDKHKKPVYTHSFGHDSIKNVKDADNYMEKRGDKTFMKTEDQRRHDKYKDVVIKETQRRLERKFYR